MEARGCIQETNKGTLPTTLTFKPEHAQLEIIRKSRQVVDFDKVGQSTERPNANRFYQENGFGTSIMLQFIVGIKDAKTNEFWYCHMRNKQRKLIFNNGTYSIEVDISPNGLVCFPPTDHKQNQLPNYQSNIKCVLPVEENEPITYQIKINLYKNDHNGKTLLDCVQYRISTHERNHDIFDYQEGRSITEVERPQLKIKMTGILAEDIGRRIIMFFQNLGDNGMYQQFYVEKRQLLRGLELLGEEFGQTYYKDLELSVVLEESIILFGQNKLDDCKETAMKVIECVMETYPPNGPFLMAKAHYIISAVYRQRGEFERSKEHMEISTELLEQVVVCEETAVNQYNWAALLAEMSARSPLSLCEKEEAEYRFQNTQLHWKTQKENPTNRCAMRAQIREINFQLETSRQRCPDLSKQVSEEALAKAAKAIQHVERNLLRDSSRRHRVTYFIAKSDYHIRRASKNGLVYTAEVRKGDVETADSILNSALAIAEELSLLKEIEGIEDRLRNIAQFMQTNEAHNQPHSPRAIVLATREPVQQDDHESIADLLVELERQSSELTTE